MDMLFSLSAHEVEFTCLYWITPKKS